MMEQLLAILVLSSAPLNGYPRGAPYSSCISQFPLHDAEQQTGPAPFTIRTLSDSYNPGENVTVEVSGTIEFIGISLTARRVVGDTEELLGRFADLPGHIQAYNCLGGQHNMVTHTNDKPKLNLSMTWIPPDSPAGDILFRATMMKTEAEFWTWVVSEHVLDETLSGQMGLLEKVENVFTEMNLEKDCGYIKGCFLNPGTCSGSDCTSAISYQKEGDKVHFEMMGVSNGYVAVAFSEDEYMGEDDVIACITDGSTVSIQHGSNYGYHYQRQYTTGITNMATAKKDGKIYCRFTRPIIMTTIVVDQDEFDIYGIDEREFNLTQQWTLFLAVGSTYDGSGELTEHEAIPAASLDKVDFSKFVVQRGRSMPLLTQIHGCLMLVAWMLLASTGTVIARYFKDGFKNRRIFGLDVWFQIHRTVAMSLAAITVAGFVIIFVKVKGWSQSGLAHAYLGIAIMSATCIQVFMGMMRPGQDAKTRRFFNWAHRILGKLTHMAAAAELILAFQSRLLSAETRKYGIIVVGIWIGLQALWEIGLESYSCLVPYNVAIYDLPRNSSPMQLDEEKIKKQANRWLPILFVLYVITVISCTAAALCCILIF